MQRTKDQSHIEIFRLDNWVLSKLGNRGYAIITATSYPYIFITLEYGKIPYNNNVIYLLNFLTIHWERID